MTVVATAFLLTAACGRSPSSTRPGGSADARGSANSSSPVAYSRCVRSHGIPDFPDPDSGGQIPKETGQLLGVSDTVLRMATQACASLNPSDVSPALQRQELTDALKFAHCMRSHGVPRFPDPATDPRSGYVEFVISISQDGFDPQSPLILAEVHTCRHGLPASELPGSPTGVRVRTTP